MTFPSPATADAFAARVLFSASDRTTPFKVTVPFADTIFTLCA